MWEDYDEWRRNALYVLRSGRRVITPERRIVVYRSKPLPHAFNISQDEYHGWALIDCGSKYDALPGYPHLRNYRGDEDISPNEWVMFEEKYNGTNIRVTETCGRLFVTSRRTIMLSRVYVYSLENAQGPYFDEVRRRYKSGAYNFLVHEAGRYYIAMPQGFYAALEASGFTIPRHLVRRYVLFFEMYGWANPILVSSNIQRGLYPLEGPPLKLVLLDVFDKEKIRFLSRAEKEELATRYGIPIAESIIRIRYGEIKEKLPLLMKIADARMIEGFVAKTPHMYFKIKPRDVFEYLARMNAIASGKILADDVERAADYAIEAIQGNITMYRQAIHVAMAELRADYPEEIIKANMYAIKEAVARRLASAYAKEYATKVMGEKSYREIMRDIANTLDSLPLVGEIISHDPSKKKRYMAIIAATVTQCLNK